MAKERKTAASVPPLRLSPVSLPCVSPQWLTGPSPLRDTRNGSDGGRGLAGRTRRGAGFKAPDDGTGKSREVAPFRHCEGA